MAYIFIHTYNTVIHAWFAGPHKEQTVETQKNTHTYKQCRRVHTTKKLLCTRCTRAYRNKSINYIRIYISILTIVWGLFAWIWLPSSLPFVSLVASRFVVCSFAKQQQLFCSIIIALPHEIRQLPMPFLATAVTDVHNKNRRFPTWNLNVNSSNIGQVEALNLICSQPASQESRNWAFVWHTAMAAAVMTNIYHIHYTYIIHV